jgi:hypothetical protein
MDVLIIPKAEFNKLRRCVPAFGNFFSPTSAVLSKAVTEIGGIAGGATGHAKLWC